MRADVAEALHQAMVVATVGVSPGAIAGFVVTTLPKFLMMAGAALLFVGAVSYLGQRLGLGRLPGDFSWQGKNFSFHLPLATSLLVSIVLTVLLNLWLGRSR
jgi:hypothetical protein